MFCSKQMYLVFRNIWSEMISDAYVYVDSINYFGWFSILIFDHLLDTPIQILENGAGWLHLLLLNFQYCSPNKLMDLVDIITSMF